MEISLSYKTDSISHPPDEPLGWHLYRVAKNSVAVFEKAAPAFRLTDKQTVRAAQIICAALHDLGKSTSFFQSYILTDKSFDPVLKAHAHISAVIALMFAGEYFQKRITDNRMQVLLPFIIYVAVKRHHGDLKNFLSEFSSLGEAENREILQLQAQNLSHHDLIKISSMLSEFLNENAELKSLVSKFNPDLLRNKYSRFFLDPAFKKLEKNERLEFYFLVQYLYSALLYSDKSDVILGKSRPAVSKNNIGMIEAYRSRKFAASPAERISEVKNIVYKNLNEDLPFNFDPGIRFYSVTLPTGLGKTIASFAAALRMGEITGRNNKVIVCIPFTSVIDQNFGVFLDITEGGSDSSRILKHHHLAEPLYKSDDDFSNEKSAFLIETWESDLIVTTFVQFFESIITNSKSKVLKLPNMAGSVIILDEIQNLPYRLWGTIRESLRVFAEIYDCYFILLTATQPMIFDPEKEIRELIRNYESYFSLFNRTVLKITSQGYEMEDHSALVNEVNYYCDANPGRNVLVILNTKNSSRAVFEELRELFPEKELFYLSTLVTPFERKKIIDLIKEKTALKQGNILMVSTQLVEAGVDISFDTVFREIAPMDSILQSAGRANRYNENNEPSEVYVFRFRGSNNFSSKIYGPELIRATESVLFSSAENPVIFENKYLMLIQSYFNKLKEFAANVNDDLLEKMCSLEFEQLAAFSLIEEKMNTAQAFIMLDEDAENIWNRYCEIISSDRPSYERRSIFRHLRNIFYDYVINVPVKKGEETALFNKEAENGFYVWRRGEDEFYSYNPENYSENTGFIKPVSGVL